MESFQNIGHEAELQKQKRGNFETDFQGSR